MWTKPQRGVESLPEQARELYGERLTQLAALAASPFGVTAEPVETVAAAVEHALTASNPKTRYLVGPGREAPRPRPAPPGSGTGPCVTALPLRLRERPDLDGPVLVRAGSARGGRWWGWTVSAGPRRRPRARGRGRLGRVDRSEGAAAARRSAPLRGRAGDLHRRDRVLRGGRPADRRRGVRPSPPRPRRSFVRKWPEAAAFARR